MTGYLPHHRRGPRIDERREDPDELRAVARIFIAAYVAIACTIIAVAFGVVA